MRKIKKFKIPIYTYDILRKARKRKIDLFSLGLADQESAKEHVASLASALEPSTVFDLVEPGEEFSAKRGFFRPGQGTLGVITLGAAFEARLAAVTDPGLRSLAETAAVVFAETGLKVVSELIEQEIAPEGLSLGEPSLIFAEPVLLDDPGAAPLPEDPEVLPDCLARLSADKIGVRFDSGRLSPRHTLLFAAPWLAGKKKKQAPVSK